MKTDYNIKPTLLIQKFQAITERLLNILPKYELIIAVPYWKRRLIFTEAMLIIANAPFHLRNDSCTKEKLAIGLYAKGVQLLNDFLERYPLTNDKKIRHININPQQGLWSPWLLIAAFTTSLSIFIAFYGIMYLLYALFMVIWKGYYLKKLVIGDEI